MGYNDLSHQLFDLTVRYYSARLMSEVGFGSIIQAVSGREPEAPCLDNVKGGRREYLPVLLHAEQAHRIFQKRYLSVPQREISI